MPSFQLTVAVRAKSAFYKIYIPVCCPVIPLSSTTFPSTSDALYVYIFDSFAAAFFGGLNMDV